MPMQWGEGRQRHVGRAVLGVLAIMAGVTEAATVARAQEPVEERNRRIVQSAFDRWRDGTGGVFDLLVPDATWTIVGNSRAAGTFRSRQEFMERVIEPFNAGLASKLVPSVRAVYAMAT